MKLLPYVNNEHIANVYKLYGPSKNDLYKLYGSKKYIDGVHKSKRSLLDNSHIVSNNNLAMGVQKMNSKRKLSPINKKMIRI
jgi:hypothetical protein